MQALRDRRAARAAQLRRRRLRVGGALILVLITATAVVDVVSGGHAAVAHRRAKPPAAGSAAASPRPAVRLNRRWSRIEALGDARIRRLAQLGLPVYCGGPHGNEVAFTFDDGPGPYTHYAIKKLIQAGERATFFVVGRSMDKFPRWLPREMRVAAIGDHTYTHPVLTGLAPKLVESEIRRTRNKIAHAGDRAVYLFRPPYGARDPMVDQVAKRLGLLEVLWTVDSGDSLGANWAGIIRNVEAGLHPGAIILMHENRGQTIRALTTLLPVLHRRHLRSVSLPQMFANDPPSVAQIRRGQFGCNQTVKLSNRPS